MNKLSQIKKLKKEAKKYYLAYYAIADTYSCGLFLAENISSDMRYYKLEFNKTMDRLRELDPTVPEGKL